MNFSDVKALRKMLLENTKDVTGKETKVFLAKALAWPNGRKETSRSMCIETIHPQFWKTFPNPSTNGSPRFLLTKNALTAQKKYIKRHWTRAVTVTTFHIRLHPVRQDAGPDNATSSGITRHTPGTWKRTLENAFFPSLTSSSQSLTPYTNFLTTTQLN